MDGPDKTRGEALPRYAGLLMAIVGLVNVGSALSGELPARMDTLLSFAPAAEVELAHRLALPAGLALIALAWPLARRTRWAWIAATALLALTGMINLAKGLEIEEAMISWSLGGLLWWAREAFWVVRPETGPLQAIARRLQKRPDHQDHSADRQRAAALVRRHGADTLSAFKLRQDLQRHWSPDGRALVAYRVRFGSLLVAGDPIGPEDALPALLTSLRAHARERGLRLGAVGASEAFAKQAHAIGLRKLYIGDEAIVPAGPMNLEGRQIRKLRQGVARVARSGYTTELRRVDELDADTRHQLEDVSVRWRDGAAERGFSMAPDQLIDDLLPDALLVIGRDADQRVRGFLQFVPVFGRDAVSLGFMRRDRDTPNGLGEYLVVEAARLLGEAKIESFSLNFVTCGRWLREPATLLERGLAKILRVADRWFQIERLLRFTQKFSPSWQPRYLLFEHAGQLPRVALAAVSVEGQLPEFRSTTKTAEIAPATGA